MSTPLKERAGWALMGAPWPTANRVPITYRLGANWANPDSPPMPLTRRGERKAIAARVETCTRPATFWEKGPVRYLVMSWSLWARHIFFDVIGRKPKKRRKK